MTDNALDNNPGGNEDTDNMAQVNDQSEEAWAKELNTDDSISESQAYALEINKDEELDKLRRELEAQKDKYLRLVAEFDNFKRRNAKERMELTQTAGRDIVQSLLEVMDDCERATKQLENSKDIDALKEGLSLVFNKLRNTLQNKGLKAMDSMNQPFNPDLHEAIAEVPVNNEEQTGKIIDVVQPGYYLNDKLIRHAKVVVGK